MLSINPCCLCPRECGVDRTIETGYCRCGSQIKVARAAPHFWEEPSISGTRGSGTVFFSGCTLQCCYCQNRAVSLDGFGREISEERLSEIFLELQHKGVHNINLVTATQYLPSVMKALEMARPALDLPVVFNCGGYERAETVCALDGYADVYLPDIKYFSGDLSQRYSGARDYFEKASAAIAQMIRQTDGLVYDAEGLLQKGVIIRHLVLPGCRKDSIRILNWISENLPKGKYLLSLLSQYTPNPADTAHAELARRVTSYEYKSVVNEALRLGLTDGYMQHSDSAVQEYIPLFDLEGV